MDGAIGITRGLVESWRDDIVLRGNGDLSQLGDSINGELVRSVVLKIIFRLFVSEEIVEGTCECRMRCKELS